MGLSSVILRPMTVDDISGGMRLSIEEGWNQTEDDWRFLIETKENICIVAEHEGKIIGTTTISNYENNVAWIGMVLVDKEFRCQGVSKLLLKNILKHADKFKSIKLDATPAGQKVYEKFGFKEEYRITRMVATAVKNISGENDDEIFELKETDVEEIIALDKKVFGADRRNLISSLINNPAGKAYALKYNNLVIGFILGRRGSKYEQIGPLVANSFQDAKRLIVESIRQIENKSIVVDILNDKQELISFLENVGFVKQREFIRMYKKGNDFKGRTEFYHLICGPEFG